MANCWTTTRSGAMAKVKAKAKVETRKAQKVASLFTPKKNLRRSETKSKKQW